VYQDSINQLITEYLVNFDYLDSVLDNYGFKLIDREEAMSLGLPEGSGLFSELFMNMMEEIKKNKNKSKDYGEAINMSEYEKKISFLNRYFVYKKIAHVNAEKVSIELMEETMSEGKEKKEIKGKPTADKKSKKPLKGTTKPKVKKLTQVLVLEDNEETVVENEPESPAEVAREEKIVEEKEEATQAQLKIEPPTLAVPVKKPRKPYTKKLVIGKDTEIKDVENIEEPQQPKKAKKAKSKNVDFVIEE
jgi:hypothetical protein